MEQLAKFITDERTGLKYELCGDYYVVAGEDEPEREPIGLWGQRHLKYIQKCCKPFFNKMIREHTLYDYLLQIDRDAEEMFSKLVKRMAIQEGVSEQLKADNQIEWVGKMNNIRQRATEIINHDIIYN
ncbi:MAG: TnpV protein [Clostridia bacterium]|nr:TnpV protein [Clostridia bacterium]